MAMASIAGPSSVLFSGITARVSMSKGGGTIFPSRSSRVNGSTSTCFDSPAEVPAPAGSSFPFRALRAPSSILRTRSSPKTAARRAWTFRRLISSTVGLSG